MKRIFVLCGMVALLAACNKEDNNGKLDPNAMIALNPAPGVKADDPVHLTAREIVEQTYYMSFINPRLGSSPELRRGFSDSQRDLVNNRLLMFGTDIIDAFGYHTTFIEGENMVLVRMQGDDPDLEKRVRDTIAYIPNSVLREAETKIKAAYDQGDYTTCYSLFDKAFTFTPITGAEWEALKAEGKN